MLAGGAALAVGAVGLAAARISRARRPPLTLASLLPRSGYLAPAGEACDRGVQLALILAPQLGFEAPTVLSRDTGESAQTAAAAAESAIADGANLLIGCYDSAQTVEVAAIAERRGVPLVINVGAAPSILKQGYRRVFRNFPDADRIVEDSYRLQKALFARSGFIPRRVAVLHINNGRGIEAIRDLFPAMQMPYELVPPIAYDPQTPDVSGAVAAARASGADSLWTVSRLNDAIRITRELVRVDWTPGILMSSNVGLFETQYVRALGRYADYGVTFGPFYDPHKPLTQRLLATMATTYPGIPLGMLETCTFEAVLVALDAYHRAGSADPDGLAAALRATDLRDNVSPGPGIRFDSRGQNTALGLSAMQTRDGRARVVLPESAAELEPVCPMPPWTART